MDSINSAILSGNLSTNIYPIEGKQSIRFQLAYNRSWYDYEKKKEEPRTYYIWVQVNGFQAKSCLSLSKGSGVTVQGELSGGSYLDKNNNWQNNACIYAERVLFQYRSSTQNQEPPISAKTKPSKSSVPSRNDSLNLEDYPSQIAHPEQFDDEIPF
jgi:single-stranded DNA-binding protein